MLEARADLMRRRDFLGGLCTTVVLTTAAVAQQRRAIPQVGLVSIGSDPANPANFAPFLQQFRELGYIDGQNVIIERRFAAGQIDLIAGFTTDLVNRQVDVIVTTGFREAEAARKATSSIPIVSIVHPDLVGAGLARLCARPGGRDRSHRDGRPGA